MLRKHLRVSVSPCTCMWMCACVCDWISACTFKLKLCWNTESEASNSLNAHCPASASSRQRRQIITSLFSGPPFVLFFLFCLSKVLPWQYVELISKQKALSGKSLQTQFGHNDWWGRENMRDNAPCCSLMNSREDAGTGSWEKILDFLLTTWSQKNT